MKIEKRVGANMSSIVETAESSKGARVTGYVLSGLPVLFLLLDGDEAVLHRVCYSATTKLGYQESTIVPLVYCWLFVPRLYFQRRDARRNLLTGYLGGAVAYVRMGEGAFPILFPVTGVFAWEVCIYEIRGCALWTSRS